METIQEVVNTTVQNMVDDGSIKKLIEDNISKAIETSVSNQFKSYGNVTKQLEKALDEGLQINHKALPFETYNEQMLVLIKSKLGNMFHGQATEKFRSEIDKVLAPAPKEIPIDEFVETVVGFWKTEEPWYADHLDEYATVEVEPWMDEPQDITLKFWKQKERSSYSSARSADLNLFILRGQIRISRNQSFNPTCFNEHEAYVFKLYAAGTVLTGIEDFDPDDCDLTLKELDY